MDYDSLMDKVCEEYDQRSEFMKKFEDALADKDKLKIVNMLVEKYNCEFDEARMVADYFIDGTLPQKNVNNNSGGGNINKPKCPTCGSTNICKIGFGERMLSVGTFGLLSKKMNKTFKCKNCGYNW